MRWLTDLAEPFLPEGGIPLALEAVRRGALLEVRGRGRAGRQPIETLAVLDAGGPRTLEVRIGARVHRAERVEEAADG